MSTNSPWSVFLIFLRLGLTSFGGPVAHLGYFRDELIVRRRWMTEQQYADLIALCHFLPGPSSSQVGMGLGISQAGYAGAFAAWLGFTMPSALLLILIAYAINSESALLPPSVLHGLAIVAVAVISQAVWGMGRSLCPDKSRFTLMIAATCYLLLFPSTWGQILVMLLAALIGVVCFKPETQRQDAELKSPMSKRHGLLFLSLFFILLLLLPLAAKLFPNQALILFDAFYRAGSLVFGGGHVMLPLLQAETVPSGLVSAEAFMAGYGATQAVPGPLFTFAAFLGASMNTAYGAFITGMLCLLAIFLPSFLLVLGALPFWESLRRLDPIRAALMGVNAAVVGLLLAALYRHAWLDAIDSSQDFALALIALCALMIWQLPPWLVVIGGSLIAWLLY
ncbi:chromate efflux transporter [Oligella urethralis]|uniref:chromate efflux transporter n=1 Tax=Oligella urethralis TaxID=90245 RepID=UPI000DFAF3B0|nr:chromate efflux transporter [Oligella urethralis]SUA55278.1 chromate transporter, chromate ion transporter (CHR) family [Oligella urethralis]